MIIDDDEVRRIAALARLDPDATARAALTRELASILEYVATLDELDVEGVEPTVGVGAASPARADEVTAGLSQAEALGHAADSAGGYFRVPRVLDP